MNIREILGFSAVIPVLTISKIENAAPLARALEAGGARVLEVTLRTPVAAAAIRAMRLAAPSLIVGAGTLTRAADFAVADQAGAQFGVTPGFTSELAAAARGARFPVLPGVMTPAEIISARHAGFNVLKLFPATQIGGIELLKALQGPFPDVLFCPTGGITRETVLDFLRLSNVVCVGASWVAPPALIDTGDWTSIEERARDAAALRKME
jgi:2-dehydro-3-deoxyphosphogluconate aldolase/(4S)-4-hydroxy-2-oxoglutarate aldolase